MPLPNIERTRDKFSSFGNTSKKEDIDKEFNQVYDSINLIIDAINQYENTELSFLASKERAGEYLYINSEGQLATKPAYIDDFTGFVAGEDNIENESISGKHIQPGAISSSHLTKEVIKNMPIGVGQVTSEHIADKSIYERHIGEDITNEKIAENAIGADNLQAGIIVPEHVSDNGIPLRCLPDFGITHYAMYSENDEKTIPIQYFYLNNPEQYSLVIEDKCSMIITSTAKIKNEDIDNLAKASLLSFNQIVQDEEITKTKLDTEQQGDYSVFKILPTLVQIEQSNDKYTGYCSFGTYYVLPYSDNKFYSTDENTSYVLKISKLSEVLETLELNTLKLTNCIGFIKVYLSKNTTMDTNEVSEGTEL